MLKILAKQIKQYTKYAVLTPVFMIFEVIMEVIIPLLMANMIDLGIDAGNMGYILKIGAALLVTSFLSLFFGVFAGRFAATASAGYARNLRESMFHNVQTFSFSNIDKFSTGSIITRLTTDVTRIQMAFQMIIRMSFRSPVMFIFSLIVSFSINVKLSLVLLITIPILAVGLVLISTKVHPIFQSVFKVFDRLNTIVGENLNGIRVVKSFTREDHEKDKFAGAADEIRDGFVKAEKLLAFNGPLMQFSMYVTMLIISWFGARLVVASGGDASLGLSTGQLMSLLTYAMQILSSLMMLSMIFVMLTMSRASAERIVELLTETSDITNPANPVKTVASGAIEFDHVNFSYSRNADKPVLSDVTLHIPSGSTVGILGATGSSKSSLVQLIPRLYDVKDGSVRVGGVDVRDYDIETLRNEVAMVLQKNVLFSGTIKDNLRWGNEDATDEELKEACRLSCASDFIESFPDQYDTFIEQGGTNVSGGQKQRLCIARALLKQPKILILDDSTSAVDTKTDAMIRIAMKQYIPETTKLIIAQRVSSVMEADQIVILDDGRISAVGTHEELLKTSKIYREVFESQTKGDEENA